MKKLLLLLLFIIGILSACQKTYPTEMRTKDNTPPVSEKKYSLLEAHGNIRVDPYFWMQPTINKNSS